MPHLDPTSAPTYSQRHTTERMSGRAPRRALLAQLPLALFVLLLLLAGCSATGADTGATQATDTPLPPAATATTAPTTPTTAASGNAVKIVNFGFSPATLTIKAGASVTWTNTTTSTPHTVTSNTGVFDHPMSPGDTFSFTFSQPGTYKYHCMIHPTMTAQIVVTA